MITINEFEKLLESSENQFLDFKSKIYDFDNDERATSKFIKDIIAFSNTPRRKKGYIVFGVKVLEDGTKVHEGIPKLIDDAILQQKIKDKVTPIPKFNFYPI